MRPCHQAGHFPSRSPLFSSGSTRASIVISKSSSRVPRDLVSAMLAIAYTAVLLVVGELYITSRSTELPAISIKQSASMPQAFHAIPAAAP